MLPGRDQAYLELTENRLYTIIKKSDVLAGSVLVEMIVETLLILIQISPGIFNQALRRERDPSSSWYIATSVALSTAFADIKIDNPYVSQIKSPANIEADEQQISSDGNGDFPEASQQLRANALSTKPISLSLTFVFTLNSRYRSGGGLH